MSDIGVAFGKPPSLAPVARLRLSSGYNQFRALCPQRLLQVYQLVKSRNIQLSQRQGIQHEPLQAGTGSGDGRMRLLLEIGRVEEHQWGVEAEQQQAWIGLRCLVPSD